MDISPLDKIYRKSLSKGVAACLGMAASTAIIFFGHPIWGGVTAIGMLVIVSFIVSGLDPLHPLTWFPPALFLYSIAYPVLVFLGEAPPANQLKDTLVLEWIALITFILFMGRPNRPREIQPKQAMGSIRAAAWPVYIVSMLLTFVYVLSVYTRGLTSKYEMALDDSIFSKLAAFFSIFIIGFVLLLAHSLIVERRIPKLLVTITLGYTLFALFIIGERDLVLKVFLVLVLLVHALYRPIQPKILVAIGVGGIALTAALGNLKNVLVRASPIEEDKQSFLATILEADFFAASENLHLLISSDHQWKPFYGETFWWDLQVLFGMSDSTVAWFNKTYYPGLVARGGGNGFTLVGEGYINFGVAGIVLVFAALALVLRILYLKSGMSVMWLAIYVASVPIFIYAIRADVATILTQVSTHIALPLIFIFFAKRTLERAPNRTWVGGRSSVFEKDGQNRRIDSESSHNAGSQTNY